MYVWRIITEWTHPHKRYSEKILWDRISEAPLCASQYCPPPAPTHSHILAPLISFSCVWLSYQQNLQTWILWGLPLLLTVTLVRLSPVAHSSGWLIFIAVSCSLCQCISVFLRPPVDGCAACPSWLWQNSYTSGCPVSWCTLACIAFG